MPRKSKGNGKTSVKSGKSSARKQLTKSGMNHNNSSSSSSGSVTAVKLSPCAKDYARTLGDPINGPLSCIPSYPALMTRRIRVYAKGTAYGPTATAAGGFGYVLFDPLRAACNDVTSVMFSTATSTQTFFNGTVPPPAGSAAVATNSDLSYAANFDPALGAAVSAQARVVGAVCRAQYIGTKLDQGGQMLGLHEPFHNSLSGQTFVSVDGYAESAKVSIAKDSNWFSVLYTPVDDIDLNFQNPALGGNITGSGVQFYMGICWQSPAGTPVVVQWECYSVLEVQGRNIRGKKPSHVDMNGFSAVHSATVINPEILKPTTAPLANVSDSLVDKVLGYAMTSLTSTQQVPKSPARTQQEHKGFLDDFDWGKALIDVGGWAMDMFF